MSGDVTIQSLKRLTHLPDRDADKNGDLIAGQEYYDVEFTGGSISNATLTDVIINGVTTARTERVITAAGDVTVASDDYVITMNKTVSQITTVTLPATPTTSRTIIVKDGKGDSGSFNITIDGNGNTIDGDGTIILTISYEAFELIYNGTEWNVITSYKTDGDVVGPGTATDGATAVFDGVSGNALKDSGNNLIIDTVNNRVGFGVNPPTHQTHTVLQPSDNIFIDGRTNPRTLTLGAMRQEQTAGISGTRAYHIDVNPAGFDDTRGITINADLNGSSNTIGFQGIAFQADISGATNAHINLTEFQVTGALGSGMRVDAIDVGDGISVIHQHSGAPFNMDTAFKYDDSLASYTDVTTAFSSAGTDVSLFDEINDVVYHGNATQYEAIQYILAITASGAGVKPTFEYSQGGSAWATLSVSDGTNGMRQNGNLVFTIPLDWAVDTVNGVANEYWVRVTRTQVTLTTPPTEDLVQLGNGAEFNWDLNGDVNINSLETVAGVGVGITAPAVGLHVDSNDANTVAIQTLENTAGNYQIFRSDATPEGAITGSIGDKCIDTTNGNEYIKETGTATNTGWVLMNIPVATDTILGKMSGDNNVDFKITAGAIGFSDVVTSLKSTFNGFFSEQPDIQIVESGGTVSLTIESPGGGDLTMVFSDGYTVLDCTPILSVALNAGTDTSPTLNYIYIPVSTKVLTVSTTGFPLDAEYIHIGSVLVQSAASVATDEVYKNHAHHESPSDSANQGHEALTNSWIRYQPATWQDGTALTPTITTNGGAIDNLDVATSTGNVLQLHSHPFPAFDTAVASDIYNINDPTTAYNKITDLSTIDQDSAGLTLRTNNSYYNLVIWGVVSEDETESKLFVNSPTGKYNTSIAATNDGNRTSNYNIPDSFRGTGFLIARLTLRYQTVASGTITVVQNEDLRGKFPSTFSGGTASTTTEFLDNAFRIQDETDPTKEIAFQASGITTATTRTITMPDSDVDLGNIPFTNLADGTDGELITWDAAGAPAAVAVGTTAQVLTSNGVGAAPTFEDAAASGGDVVKLGALTASTSASLDFTSMMDNTIYISYFMVFEKIKLTPGGATLGLRLSSDNGSSFFSGTNNYIKRIRQHTLSATSDTYSNGFGNEILISPTGGLGSGDNLSGEIGFYNMDSAATDANIIKGFTFEDTNVANISGQYGEVISVDIDAIQILPSADDILSGTGTLYGVTR